MRGTACLVTPLPKLPALLAAFPPCPPANHRPQMHFDRAGRAPQFLQVLASVRLLGIAYIQVHPVFFKLQKACKCQARGALKFLGLLCSLVSSFPVGDRKGNCFGDRLSQYRSINTFPLCLFIFCCYECFSRVTLMPL